MAAEEPPGPVQGGRRSALRRLGGLGAPAAGIAVGVAAGILVGGGILLAGAIYVATIFGDQGAPAVSRVIMTNEEFEALAPGTPKAEVERRHGAGSDNGQDVPEPQGLSCAYYDPRRASGVDAFQLCYDGARLRQKHQVDVAGSGGGGGFD